MELFHYIKTPVFCMLILAILWYAVHRSSDQQIKQRIFGLMLLLSLLFIPADFASGAIDQGYLKAAPIVNGWINVVYFTVISIIGSLWYAYSEVVQGTAFKEHRGYHRLAIVPVVLLFVLSCISLKTGWIFWIDGEGVYHRGPLYVLQFIFAYGLAVFTSVKALYRAFQPENYTKRREYLTLARFLIFPLLMGICQLQLPGENFLSFGITVAALDVFINMQNALISRDPLTGLENRRAFEKYMENCLDAMKQDGAGSVYLLMMDVDYFKTINDTYGHHEGDVALQKVADILKRACNGTNCIVSRFGGDEFAIVGRSGGRDMISAVCRRIEESLNAECENLPYTLHLSMGMAECYNSEESVLRIFERADAELYKVKKGRT